MAFSAVFGMSLLEHGVPLQQGCSVHKYIESYLLKMKYSFVQQGVTWTILSSMVFVKREKSSEKQWPLVAMCCACSPGGSFILGKSWFASQWVCCYETPETEISLRGWVSSGGSWSVTLGVGQAALRCLFHSPGKQLVKALQSPQCLCRSDTPESLILSPECQIPPIPPQTPGAQAQFALYKHQGFYLNGCSSCMHQGVEAVLLDQKTYSVWSLGAAISWGFCSSCHTCKNVTRREVTPIWQLVSWSRNQSCLCDFTLPVGKAL